MSIKVMSWVWDHSRSKGIDRLVLLAIADSADDTGGNAWPAVATIARKCGGISPRTVQRSIKDLVLLRELAVDKPGSGRNTSRYRVKMRQPRQVVTPDKLSPLTASHPSQSVTPDAAVTPGGSESHPRGDAGVTQSVLEPSTEPSSTNDLPTAARQAPVTQAMFDEFWSIYPRREAKAKAQVAFKRSVQKVGLEAVLRGARRYRDDPNRELQYTAHPATWLNAGRWDDEPLPPRNGHKPYGGAAEVYRELVEAGR